MKDRNIVAYRVEPVHEIPEGGIATAAVMRCMASSEILSGMGGGGEYLAPRVVDLLRGGGCIIMDTDGYDQMVEALRMADALLCGANMDRQFVERKVTEALAKASPEGGRALNELQRLGQDFDTGDPNA